MADESDRNLWDVLGLPNKIDVSSVQEKEQHLCINGVQEGDLDKAQSDTAQGTSLSEKAIAEPSSVSTAGVLCCSDTRDVPVKNGGDTLEQRHIQQGSAVKIIANQRRDLPGEKVELTNGEASTALEYSASVNNGSVGSTVEPPRNVPEAAEHCVITAVNANNNKQGEKLVTTQERSIFEHINSNFRPAVVPLQYHVFENITSETGMRRNTSETAVSSNVICLSDTIRNVEPSSGDVMDQNNLFERVRINSLIDSLAQRTITREGNGGFPFSEKLRHLTTINKEAGNNMSTTVHPLRTGYDNVTSGRSFQQLASVSAPRSASNAIAARIVNGQLQSLGAQVITPPEVSQVDSNVIFPSVAPYKYPSAVSTSANNSYPNRQVTSVYNAMNGTAVVIQPNAVEKLKRIAADRPNGDHAQNNLAATHLIGPFISAGPPPPNTYVAAVRTAPAQPLTNGLQSSPYQQFQDVRSSLKGHSSSSGFQLVLPVGITPVGIPQPSVVNRLLPPPISLTSLEENTSSKGNQRNLICGEKLVSSPDLQERVFRPVSPAKSGMNSRPSPRGRHDGFSHDASRGFHCLPLRARRSIFSRKTDTEVGRGSVEEELAEQSYECALRESANSPDIERYLRCESPLTVLSSPNPKSSCNSCESNSTESSESHVNSSALCNGEAENADIPYTYPEENTEDCSSPKTPPSTDSGIDGEETDASKKKLNSAMVRRLEPRLPSPVRERSAGDLYRDPSQLTREERALQRAMMQFSEMEMKEKAKEIKKKDSFKRRLRKRPKDKPNTITNDLTKQSATKVWLKKFKRKRLWFSQRRSVTVKPPVQEDDSLVKRSEDQHTRPVKRKRSNDSTEQPKIRRKSVETDKRGLVAKPKDVHQTKAVLPNHKNTGTKPAKVRRTSRDTRGLEKNKKENLPESTSCKRSSNIDDISMGKKAFKRPRVEIEPLRVKKQDVIPHNNADSEKGDKSHRVKTYMLVTAYQGFRDFKPIVLESRTRGKSKQSDEEPQQKPNKASEFPLLVVESVNSKPVKNSIIAENEEVQHLVENCLKARGKWPIDEIVEETLNEDEILKEARKLNVNRNTGETILHKAARLGYHETVRHHIHQGIDPNAKDNAGWTPLHEACSRGHVNVVKVLAKYGADVNACSNDGIRPIHDAAEGGHVGVLRVLLTYGADPLLATYSGNTALRCTKEPNSSAFLRGFLEDVGLKNPSTSAWESEGCWEFSGSWSLLDNVPDHTSGIFEGVPTNNSLQDGEFEMCDRPHIPTYNLPVMTSEDVTSGRRNYVLLSDVLEHLRISRGALLKKAKRLDIREMPWSQFMAEIVDKPLCVVPKYSPPDSSTQEGVAELVSVNYNLRRLLNIRIESVNMT